MKNFPLSLIALALLYSAPADARPRTQIQTSFEVFKGYRAVKHVEKPIRLAQIIQFSGAVAAGGGGGFTGLLDTYSANGATWYVSCAYKSTNAYAGNCGTITRDDLSTLNLGFLSNGSGNVSAFNTFCSGHLCYLSSWVDQVNGVNATQATLANMPRVIVDANSQIAICPQPGSWMATSFNAAVNTQKQHFFGVALPAFLDSRFSQPGVANVTVTGNVTSGSSSISSMSSQAGISTVNGGTAQSGLPGVVDSSGFLPNGTSLPGGTAGSTFLNTLPTGTTASLGFNPGNLSPTGSKTGDTLTVTNSVISGAWLVNGPTTTYWPANAYWGVGMGSIAGSASRDYDEIADWNGPRNGDDLYVMHVIGEGIRGNWGVYDYDTFTNNLSYNGVALGDFGNTSPGGSQPANANITYSTSVGMTLFGDPSHNANEATSQACFETMVLFPATQSQRVAMSQFLMTQGGITNNNFAAPTTSDGFTMTGWYQPWREWGTSGSNSSFGNAVFGPDVYGMTWANQSGGYAWPSVAFANNINNSTTMWRFIVETGDSDMLITHAERAETCASPACQAGTSGAGVIAPGQHASVALQLRFEQIPTQTADWCYTAQIHYQNSGTNPDVPDIMAIDCLNNQLQININCCESGSSPASQTCGVPITPISTSTVYALEAEIFWSTNHTSDTFVAHFGPNGSTLPLACSLSGALFATDTAAFMKAGIYRGFPDSNAGTVILRVMNNQWSNTANAFSGFITTQTALPTHP